MIISPIAIFCYNRPTHFNNTITSLLNNPYCSDSLLYIFSDGPKDIKDRYLVEEVRFLASQITGFKEVIIYNSEVNKGLAKSIIEGVTSILKTHNSIIVLEDDLIVSEDFLNFMNHALNLYSHTEYINSISGFKFPFELPQDYTNEVYLLPRICSYGWGTWKDRWEQCKWGMGYFPAFIKNKKELKHYKEGGEDLVLILLKQFLTLHDSWAIRWDYYRFITNSYTLYPVEPKVITIGNDGSGTHDSKRNIHNTTLSSKKVSLPKNITPNKSILKNMGVYFKLNPLKKIYYYYLLIIYKLKYFRPN